MPHIQLSDSRKHQYTCHPPTAPIRAHQHSLTYRICTANYAKISTTYFLVFNVVVTPSFVRMVFMRCSCANVKRTIFVATDSAALKCISCETRQLHAVSRPFDDLARVRLNRNHTLLPMYNVSLFVWCSGAAIQIRISVAIWKMMLNSLFFLNR